MKHDFFLSLVLIPFVAQASPKASALPASDGQATRDWYVMGGLGVGGAPLPNIPMSSGPAVKAKGGGAIVPTIRLGHALSSAVFVEAQAGVFGQSFDFQESVPGVTYSAEGSTLIAPVTANLVWMPRIGDESCLDLALGLGAAYSQGDLKTGAGYFPSVDSSYSRFVPAVKARAGMLWSVDERVKMGFALEYTYLAGAFAFAGHKDAHGAAIYYSIGRSF